MATTYYPRADSLLVALFHRVERKKASAQAQQELQATADGSEAPKLRAIPQETFETGDANDGERKWRAPYKVLPDFQNFLAYFADEIVFETEPIDPPKFDLPPPPAPSGKQPPPDPMALLLAEHAAACMKYQLDEELIPERILDIEDDKI